MRIPRSFLRRNSPHRNTIDDELWNFLLVHHPILEGFSTDELDRLRSLTERFAAGMEFEGAEGVTVTGDMRAVVSVQAALPILGLGFEWYRNWNTVVILPAQFKAEHVTHDRAGVTHEWTETDSGESWINGPVCLSWHDVDASGWGDGYNVVIHEAAHRLDMTDGGVNGRPKLHATIDPKRWFAVCSEAYNDLALRASRHTNRIDPYAIENDAEFFAVVTEYFFELPEVLRGEYPDLYSLFADFYRQDPYARKARVHRRV